MTGRSRSPLRPRRSPSRKSPRARNRLLRGEWLEPRELLSVSATKVNAPPTVANVISVNANAAVTGTSAAISVLGADDGGESNLTYTWSVTTAPAGGAATFKVNGTNAAKTDTATFTKVGTYSLTVKITDSGGLSVSSVKSVVVSPKLTSIHLATVAGQVLASGAALTVSGTSQAFAAQGLDQFGNALATAATLTWSITASPAGATRPTVSASGGNATLLFSKAGAYGLAVQASAGGVSLSSSVSITVAQVICSMKNTSTAPVSVSGTSLQAPVPTFVDQFGSALTTPPALTWSTFSAPQGAPAPVFTISGGVTTITFGMAGSYYLDGHVTSMPSASFADVVVVNQTVTSISVTPGTASLLQGCDQQFAAQGLDQFHKAMATQPTFTWSASAGTITAAGVFTAPASAAASTVTAHSGSAAGTATVAVTGPVKYQTTALASLVKSLDADGSISRADMLQILRSVSDAGAVTAGEFSDLKLILQQPTTLNIPGYVEDLANDVVNGSAANATYLGQALGNLAVGSSATALNDLIGKWFLGTDHPTLCNTSLVYKSTAGSLFPHTPSNTDEYQGGMGDCYFISALGTLADSNPAAVENMFIDNGDGTFTVRFYTGTYGTIYNSSDGSIGAGFTNNAGTADYVTVDRMLPASTSGILAYADYGDSCTNAANSLWIPLAEKAYAQWNQTGKEGRDGTNAFASIQGGWMATVDAQVLGHNATDYIMSSTTAQPAITALAAKEAVTIGTIASTNSADTLPNGLYGSHAYAITGYNASKGTFTLYNPWGFDQPGQLTWSQLQATCTQLCVCATSGSVPISGAAGPAVPVKTSIAEQVSEVVAGVSSSASAAALPSAPASAGATFSQSGLEPVAAPGSLFSEAPSASQSLFDTWGSNWQPQSPPVSFAGSVDAAIPASLVDATFAADDLLSPVGA